MPNGKRRGVFPREAPLLSHGRNVALQGSAAGDGAHTFSVGKCPRGHLRSELGLSKIFLSPSVGRRLAVSYEITMGRSNSASSSFTLFTRPLTGAMVIPLVYGTSSFFAVSAGAVSQR
jgi:hypothetical protein